MKNPHSMIQEKIVELIEKVKKKLQQRRRLENGKNITVMYVLGYLGNLY